MRTGEKPILQGTQSIICFIALLFAPISSHATNVVNGGPNDINTDEYSGYWQPDTTYIGAVTQAYFGDTLADNGATFHAIPVFIRNEHECKPGYYLPQNETTCQLCTPDSYCLGGTFAPNPNTDQGITTCPNDSVSAPGATKESQCGIKLSIGDNTIYMTGEIETHPAFVADIDGKKYYARMTPAIDGIKPMNSNTTESLMIKMDGTEYCVHDSTTDQKGTLK